MTAVSRPASVQQTGQQGESAAFTAFAPNVIEHFDDGRAHVRVDRTHYAVTADEANELSERWRAIEIAILERIHGPQEVW